MKKLPKGLPVAIACTLWLLAVLPVAPSAAASAPPKAPRELLVEPAAILLDGTLVVSWLSHSGKLVGDYTIQWKTASQAYDASRQVSVHCPPSRARSEKFVFLGDVGDAGDAEDELPISMECTRAVLEDLKDGVEHTIQVFETNEHGVGPPAETTVMPLSGTTRLRRFTEDIVRTYEGEHPWLRKAWAYMAEPGFELSPNPLVRSVVFSKCWLPESMRPPHLVKLPWVRSGDSLPGCRVFAMLIDQTAWERERTIVHEIAHVYSLTVGSGSSPASLGAALVYFDRLCRTKSRSNAECDPKELLADVMTASVLGKLNGYYWLALQRETDAPLPEREALEVVRSAVKGEMPHWFEAMYGGTARTQGMRRLWHDVRMMGSTEKRLPTAYFKFGPDDWSASWRDEWRGRGGITDMQRHSKLLVVNYFSNALGGYCDDLIATKSAFGRHFEGNPWREGGCVPRIPMGVVPEK